MKHRGEKEWTPMDNVSKIFPSTSNNKDTKVFRFSCELYEEVNPKFLQEALDITIKSFPLYKSVLRKGLFWYYFENGGIEPKVGLEETPLCAPLYINDSKNLLFRVIYYNNRINVETFHALSDGAGAVLFLENLVYHYITIVYKNELANNYPKLNFKSSISEKMDNSFEKYYNKNNNYNKGLGSEKNIKSHTIKGTRNMENRTKLIEGSMKVNPLLDLSRKHNTTLTIFLTALLIDSIFKEMTTKNKKYPIVLAVPINLRQFFPSFTARNFFSTMNITYDYKKDGEDFQEIIQIVKDSFEYNLNTEQVNLHLNKFMSIEKNPFARPIPLPIKNIALKIADKLNDRKITSSISNVGRVSIPSEFKKYIKQVSVCVSARRPLITFCSYEDTIVISFTSPFTETDIQRRFFKSLSDQGMEIEILSNI